MNFFFPFTNPLEDYYLAADVLEIVKASFNHLAKIECFRAASLRSEEIEPLLSFRGKSDGSRHIDISNTCIQCITTGWQLRDKIEWGGFSENIEILVPSQKRDIPVETGLSDQRVAEASFTALRRYFRPQPTGALPVAGFEVNHGNLRKCCRNSGGKRWIT